MRLKNLLAALPAAFLLAACGGSGNSGLPANSPRVQIVNAVADAPNVAALVNQTRLVSALGYAVGTVYVQEPVGSAEIRLASVLPGNQLTTLADQTDVQLKADNDYAIYALGSLASKSTSMLVVDTPRKTLPAGDSSLRIVDANDKVGGNLDVYLTSLTASLSGTQPQATVTPGQASDAINLSGGSYRLRITVAGDPTQVLLDSGSSAGITLPVGRRLQLAIVDNTGPGSASIRALLIDGANSTTPTTPVVDAATPVQLQVIQALDNVGGNVDLYATPSGSTPGTPLASNLASGTLTNVCGLTGGGAFDLAAAPTGAGADAAINGATLTDQTLNAGQTYTLVLSGVVGGSPSMVLAQTSLRPISGEARLLFANGDTVDGPVDVYVTPAGSVTASQIESGSLTPALQNLYPGQVSRSINVEAGSYDLWLADSDTHTLIAQRAGVTLGDGAVQTYTLLAPSGGGGSTSLLESPAQSCP